MTLVLVVQEVGGDDPLLTLLHTTVGTNPLALNRLPNETPQ